MTEPLTLAEAKQHLRITHSSEDAYLSDLIVTARMDVEAETWRAVVREQRAMTLAAFPAGDDPIYLPCPPLVSVDSVEYLDADGNEQELLLFRVATDNEPGQLLPAYGQRWPSTREDPSAVVVTYTAGYADEAVSANAKHCVRLRLAELYEGRSPAVAEKRTTFERLIEKLRFRDSRILPFVRGVPDVHMGL